MAQGDRERKQCERYDPFEHYRDTILKNKKLAAAYNRWLRASAAKRLEGK